MDKQYSSRSTLWNHGYVIYRDHLGTDLTPLFAARMSTGNETGTNEKSDNNTRSYLWRKGHVSVFEQAFVSVEIKVPIFIARQVMRHKGLHVNEFSMRYSEPLHEYYIPGPGYVCIDNNTNKQSSGAEADPQVVEDFVNDALSDAILHKARYEKHRNRGISKERVRDSQPVSAYTKIWITANLRDWFFFLAKRLKPDAQQEIQDLGWAIYDIIKDLFPLCAELFEEHTLHASTFSKSEMAVIKKILDMTVGKDPEPADKCAIEMIAKENGLEGSRLREFKEKLDL